MVRKSPGLISETGALFIPPSDLIAVAIAVPPIAVAFVGTCRARCDGSADSERDPATIAPVSAAPMMIPSVAVVSATVRIMLAAIVTWPCIGRRNRRSHDKCRRSKSSKRANIFFHLCLVD